MNSAYEPKAPRRNTAVVGNARFTFLTDRFVRMEWSTDGRFVDEATFAVVNRRMPAVFFERSGDGGSTTLTTSALRLRYTNDGRPFSRNNLEAVFTVGAEQVAWHPERKDRRNLGGSYRTLDGCDGPYRGRRRTGDAGPDPRPLIDLGSGLLSRSGWGFYDDSTGMLLVERPEGGRWFASRPDADGRDWYLLAYGRDYLKALEAASRVFGRQPLPPRYALGYWWSRYWAYTDRDFEELVREFDRMDLPLDVLIVDMDWHLAGWTGYTWNRHYFPAPEEFLSWVKRRGIRVSLNLHPADGVGKHEAVFEEMAKRLGLDPKAIDRIPFDCTDPAFMEAYFALLHHPREREGVDFWWIDWQQGSATAVEGLDPLPWLNILHWEDMERKASPEDRRPLIFSRFGGVGSGRTPVGFSGDTFSTWESLQYQPYFTSTASNVLYGYWSHDIGGHMPGEIEPELYTRWIQFGVFSPILRTHTTKNAEAERRTWEYPDPHSRIMRDALLRRHEMVPYIYSEDRRAADSGVSLCRPLYYHWPEEEEAYQSPGQYMFGELMMAAPVTSPMDVKTGTAVQELWLPPGPWIDTATGRHLRGPGRVKNHYLLEEIPVFVRPGAVIPGRRDSRRLSERSIRNLMVTLWPGADGEYLLYEDDGISQGYMKGEAAWLHLSQREAGFGRSVRIRLKRGDYPGFLTGKSLEIRLPGTVPPVAVKVDGEEIPWRFRPEEKGGSPGWTYDGNRATTIIRLPGFDVREGINVRIRGNRSFDDGTAAGLAGLLSRLNQVRYYTTLCSSVRPLHPEETLPVFAAQTGNRISRHPASFDRELRELGGVAARLPRIVSGIAAAVRKRMPHDEKRLSYLSAAAAILNQTRKDFADTLEGFSA